MWNRRREAAAVSCGRQWLTGGSAYGTGLIHRNQSSVPAYISIGSAGNNPDTVTGFYYINHTTRMATIHGKRMVMNPWAEIPGIRPTEEGLFPVLISRFAKY